MTGMMAASADIGVTRIGQIAFTVSNLAGAVSFSRDVLGLRFLFEAPPSLAFFDCGGTRLMLAPPEREGAFAGQQFNSILYYTVADIQAAASALSGRGVEFDQRRTSSPASPLSMCGSRPSAIPTAIRSRS